MPLPQAQSAEIHNAGAGYLKRITYTQRESVHAGVNIAKGDMVFEFPLGTPSIKNTVPERVKQALCKHVSFQFPITTLPNKATNTVSYVMPFVWSKTPEESLLERVRMAMGGMQDVLAEPSALREEITAEKPAARRVP